MTTVFFNEIYKLYTGITTESTIIHYVICNVRIHRTRSGLEHFKPIYGTYGEWLQLRVVDEVQFAILHKLDRHGVFVQLGACHERIESLKTNTRDSRLCIPLYVK